MSLPLIAFPGFPFAQPFAQPPFFSPPMVVVYVPYPAPPAAPAAPAAPASPKPKEPKKDSPAAATPAPEKKSALPPRLVEHLKTEGPYEVNKIYSVVPDAPLQGIEEEGPIREWYAITRGRFVGVVDQYALSDIAITGVAYGARKAYPNQDEALYAFNQALHWGAVQIV
ncbi:hypothetical protein R3P38DRAFT_2761808 [Favolaschia claudopus]|uniref:Uncharacterized protein n=1 Tax=Favolaschia claudopus TaxID=2862362 RepID=A0AAW0DQA0_9AGAR